ncbi:MAG: DAK2 domain-containing protein, partial [Eubacteriaceae bacterium]|nr:DAK2 domain-containing protein [Eubacteriaceae bacterium]
PAESKIEKYGVISVASGEGLKTLFADLGAKEVIMGGQTMNPSTQDFIEAINRMNAENIIILPNNSNIILAANQTKEISEKNIIVIPTKTIPQGITSLLSFDADKSMEENIETMTEVIKMVKTGQVTYAVRDTSFNGKEIKKDDIIGIIDNEIVCLGDNPDFVLLDIVDRMADESSELISVYYGSAVEESDAKKLILSIEEKYSGLDVELHNGGQPLYYYIVSVE